MKKFRKYRLALIFLWITVVAAAAQFIFITLPVYELAGGNDPNAADKLTQLQAKAGVSKWLVSGSFVAFLILFVRDWVQKHDREL